MVFKICSSCKTNKSTICFNKNKTKTDGFDYYCKDCRKLHRNKMKDHCNAYTRKWKSENKEHVSKYNSEYSSKNRENIRERRRNTPIELKRIWENKQVLRGIRKRYKKENRNKLREYQKNRRKNNIQVRLKDNISSRVRMALKNNFKKGKTLELIGCDISILKDYLESKFLPTMSWENYGKVWQIDHIIPCILFDLTSLEQQKTCFHYSNLQPLFSITTSIDGIKYIGNLNKNKYI